MGEFNAAGHPPPSTGLTAAADAAFDRFAAMVCNVLDVPVALVSLAEPDRQVFPGAEGLPEPWQRRRQAPLSHSFCRHVVADAAPFVVEDARTDPRTAGSPAITELGMIGYAGMPLTDDTGIVLGALCAVDPEPRRWTPAELALLADLAAACSDSLRLRIANHRARRRAERARAQTVAADAAFDRSQLLLRASVALANTSSPDDVFSAVHDLVTGTLDPAYVGLSLLTEAGRWDQDAGAVSALACRAHTPILLPDLAAVAAQAPDAVATFTEKGWQAAASVPLPGPNGPVGALTVVWKQAYEPDAAEQTVLAALAGYVAQALHRADYLWSRENVAEILQRALLSDLPDPAPYELAARYEPAARGEQVGGDWYDAIRLDGNQLGLVIGDVTGHDMGAAARMGQLRNKLRLLLIDRHEPPSALLRRLDTATQALGDRITATAILAFLRPEPGGAGHRLLWSNAGHLSPLLVSRSAATVLAGRDILLGVPGQFPRTNHSRHLEPGSTVLFYTDGLIETRRQPLHEREHQLREVLPALADLPLPDLLERLHAEFAGHDHEDDVALLAVRTPPADGRL